MKQKSLLALALVFLALTACVSEGAAPTETPRNLDTVVPGRWKVVEFVASMPGQAAEKAAEDKVIALTTIYTFNSEGTFERIDEYNPTPITGKWNYSSATTELRLTFEQDGLETTESFNVQDWENRKVSLS